MTPLLAGTVTNGVLTLHNRPMFDEYLRGLEGSVVVTVGKPRKPRSNAENAYYHGVVLEVLCQHFGYREDEKQSLHEALKQMFLKKDRLIARSTTSLSTVEMEEYLSAIRMWASAEYNVYIPLPNEV